MGKVIRDISSKHLNPFKEEPEEKVAQERVIDQNALEFVKQLASDLQQGEFDLPPFPDTALRVQQCIRDPAADNRSLAAVIATEPALAARLMRMANSALMRRGPMEVTDIPTAISRVGMTMVQNAAMSFAAREAFKAPPGSACVSELNSLRQTSVKVAAIAYVLAKEAPSLRKPDEAMLAGLLSSVGKFYIYTKAADHVELFADRRALDRLIAQWHTGVARAIVESWQFPDTVAQAVDEQEVKEKNRIDGADLSDVLLIANIIARAGVKAAEHLGDLDSLARLRMDANTLRATLEAGEDDIQSMMSAMS
ncbi:MAG: HDOD domain-containing protein [Halieaceae bacterium]|uniref:HDOD domain-containing protein n=1 Tax=Haliea alexandrii TaxID=2448162 RepID=UPI001E4A6ACA|nr:HDOD domain-containing protein [Haliea alexandrii]MCR9183909.1 HDOD domain-containing protein [Halieaceae bacterium]